MLSKNKKSIKKRALQLLDQEYEPLFNTDTLSKNDCYKALCLIKLLSAINVQQYNDAKEKSICHQKAMKFISKEYKNKTIQIVNIYLKELDMLKMEQILYGDLVKDYLEIWQMQGASIKEFLQFCNVDMNYIEKNEFQEIIEDEELGFFDMLFICGLDYKNKTDWLEDTPNAPLTKIVNSYMLNILSNTKEGREAGRSAIQKVFPEIMDMMIDADDIEN